MIKIKLYDTAIHRNECTFRPYIYAQNSLRDIGIELTTGDSYDFAWIAQGSFIDKKVSLEQSVNNGLEYLSKITGDYMLIDGQDSTSLMGSFEVLKESNAILLLKNSLLKDRNLYKHNWNLGRYYWGSGSYSINDFDTYSDKIKLSGTNWLMTHWAGINPNWYNITKKYDIAAMFQYPSTNVVYEHGNIQSRYYDNHRKPLIDIIDKISSYNIAKLYNGERVSIQEYYDRVTSSKITLAPYGYGEMAPRDIEATMFNSILIKPNMDYIDTAPNIFIENQTYIPCKHDFSDLEEKIDMILTNYDQYQYIIENSKKIILETMHPNNVALHLYNIFKNLNGIIV